MSRILFLAASAALLIASGGCRGNQSSAPIVRYHMHGVVVNVDATAHAANISHDKIVGYMGAMTMEYPVRDSKELAALHAGEKIDATLFVQDTDFWVGDIHEAK